MKRRTVLYMLGVLISLLLVIGMVRTEEGVLPSTGDSYDGIPEDAVVVDVQRLDTCDEDSDPNDLCYYVVLKAGPEEVRPSGVMAPLSTTNWYICGIRAYNYLGGHVGTLTNYTQATYDDVVYDKWKLLTGFNTTWAATGYSWSNLSGPNPNPGWNVWTYSGSTRSDGKLTWISTWKWYWAKNLFYRYGNWGCTGGSYY